MEGNLLGSVVERVVDRGREYLLSIPLSHAVKKVVGVVDQTVFSLSLTLSL